MVNAPDNALLELDGSFYKFGLHRHVYLWVSGEWKKSERPPEDLFKEVLAKIARLESKL